jgi:hypothetical protein
MDACLQFTQCTHGAIVPMGGQQCVSETGRWFFARVCDRPAKWTYRDKGARERNAGMAPG